MWWADSPTSTFHMALHVRVGQSDEPLHLSGITHLVEHLVMNAAGRREHPHNAVVDGTECVFYAEGEREEVLEYLGLVGRAIAAVDLGKLEHERRVLRTEAVQREPTPFSRLVAARFGLRGHGLAGDEELGLRWVGEAEVRDWWLRHFTRGNTALWMTGEPPEDLGFELPDGPRVPPPAVEPLPLQLPGFMADGTGGVVLTGLAERHAAVSLGVGIATERLYERLRHEHGVAYAPYSGYAPLTADTAHVMLGSDGRDEDAHRLLSELWGCVNALAEDGPTGEELEKALRATERARRDPQAVLGDLAFSAGSELFGRPHETLEEIAAELAAVDGAAVAGVMRALLETAILLGPAGSKPVDGLDFIPALQGGEPEGERFRRPRPGLLKRRADEELWVGEHSLTWREGESRTTIAWDSVILAEVGPGKQVHVVAGDGRALPIASWQWEDGERAVESIRARVNERLVIPYADRALAAALDAALERRVKTHFAAIAPAVDALPFELSPEEGVLDVARATTRKGFTVGVLVVTERRVLWLASMADDRLELDRADVRATADHGELTLEWPDGDGKFVIDPKGAASELAALI